VSLESTGWQPVPLKFANAQSEFKECAGYSVLQESLDGGAHGAGAEGFVETGAQNCFHVGGGDFQVVAEVAQAREFGGNHGFADFALHGVGKTGEDSLRRARLHINRNIANQAVRSLIALAVLRRTWDVGFPISPLTSSEPARTKKHRIATKSHGAIAHPSF